MTKSKNQQEVADQSVVSTAIIIVVVVSVLVSIAAIYQDGIMGLFRTFLWCISITVVILLLNLASKKVTKKSSKRSLQYLSK